MLIVSSATASAVPLACTVVKMKRSFLVLLLSFIAAGAAVAVAAADVPASRIPTDDSSSVRRRRLKTKTLATKATKAPKNSKSSKVRGSTQWMFFY